MDKITTDRLLKLLSRDQLYGDDDIVKSTINFISISNSVQLYFCGYLYGVKDAPIVDITTPIECAKYTEESLLEIGLTPRLYNFKPIDRYIKHDLDSLAKVKDVFFAGSIEQVEWAIKEMNKLNKLASENNTFQIQFLTTILANGLEYIHNSTTNQMNFELFFNFLESSYDGCLLEALHDITITKGAIYRYFSENFLPLPGELYPEDLRSSKRFMEKQSSNKWDVYDVIGHFKSFYSESIAAEEGVHSTNFENDEKFNSANGQLPITEEDAAYAFYKDGQVWQVTFDGNSNIFNDTVGMSFIHSILSAGVEGVSPYSLATLQDKSIIDEKDKNFDSSADGSDGFQESYWSKVKTKGKIDINHHLQKVKEEELDLESRYNNLEISREEYERRKDDIKKIKEIIYNSNRKDVDKNAKKIYDRVATAIKRALKIINEHDTKLYNHIYQACQPKKSMYYYTTPANIKWKFFK